MYCSYLQALRRTDFYLSDVEVLMVCRDPEWSVVWMEQAIYDRAAAEDLRDAGKHWHCVVLCQQSVEKALKGMLEPELKETWKGFAEIRQTFKHNLVMTSHLYEILPNNDAG